MTLTTDLRRLQSDVGDLIASRERGSDLEEFARYENDPCAFVIDVLKAQPWEAQTAIAASVRDHPLVVVRSCNAAGKDWVAAALALWWVYVRRGLVLLTGPTQRQVREIVMGEVGRAWYKARDLPGELYASALRVGGSEHMGILAFTSSEASRMTGFHAPRVLIVITEAQAVEPWTWEAAFACATGSEDRILAVGNPLSPSGKFYDVCNSPSWTTHAISAFETPNVKEGSEAVPGMITTAGVARIESEYGKGSGVYRARVLGQFPEEDVYGLIRRAWLEEAYRKFQTGELQGGGQPILAVDPARYGPDKSVMAVRRGAVLRELVVWSKCDLMQTVEKIQAEAGKRGVTPDGKSHGKLIPHRGQLVIDEIGLGSGVYDRLRELRYDVAGFNASRLPSADKDKLANTRAAAFWKLRKLLEDGQVAILKDELLWDELTAIQWKLNSAGKIVIESKDDLRSRLGRSIDRADATAMAFGFERREARVQRWVV